MRYLFPASLLCIFAWSGAAQCAPDAKEQPFLTEAEGSACMGDDKSRKHTEEVARDEAKRRAAEQAATQVRAQSRVSIGTLEEDVIKIISGGKVRILQVLQSKWDKDGCYTYRIRAEVTQSKPGETPGIALTEEERLWNELEDAPDLRAVDQFLSAYPFSVHTEKAKALQGELEGAYPRIAGPYLVYRDTALYLRPALQAISISEVPQGEVLQVHKIQDAQWAVIKRDVGQVYTPFGNLRAVTDDEATAWTRCLKNGKDARGWQGFLQTYPKSHLARLAKERLTSTENRLSREDGLSKQDSEEIALWNRCLKTRDMQCAREYRRRYPNGKFEKESWNIR
ncbi:MAG: hypothetical protein B7Y41_13905 [Hydrogenophilales bacterium 28-61-23]|nr:MAG: hypothetical protein B7Y41_13905 [Hydrogenophilales bacterium 28-61-23]